MKTILTIIILSLLLTGCSYTPVAERDHDCKIKAIKECGKDNVDYVFYDFGCNYTCKDYSKFLEE